MGKLNMKAMMAAQEELAKQGGKNSEYDKLVQGKNVRRLLWPKGDYDSFYSEGFVHYGLGEDGKTMVTCPKTFDKHNRCPVCEYVAQLQKSKDKDDKKMADDMRAKRKIYINVINRDSEEEDDSPKVLPIGVTVLKALLDILCDPDYGDITDYKDGRDITIKRTGQGLKTEYSVIAKPNTRVASETIPKEELEEQMADLEGLFREYSYEELEDILNGGDGRTDEDEDEDEDESEYDDMDLSELKKLCKKRGIPVTDKISKIKLIVLLTKYDEEYGEEDTDEDDSDDSDDSDDAESDEVKDTIARAIHKRGK